MAGADGSDAWKEVVLVSIAAQGGTDIPFQSLMETVDFDLGEKQIEGIALLNGGRVDKTTPETDTSITFEAYPLEAGNVDISAATLGTGFFDLLHAEDTTITDGSSIANSRIRNKYRIAIMFVDSDSITNANQQVVNPTNKCKRIVAADGYFVSVKPSFTDGILKYTVVYKVTPFDKSGNSKIKVESLPGSGATATLTALASYTSTIKW